jgi:hypothetical protein
VHQVLIFCSSKSFSFSIFWRANIFANFFPDVKYHCRDSLNICFICEMLIQEM